MQDPSRQLNPSEQSDRTVQRSGVSLGLWHPKTQIPTIEMKAIRFFIFVERASESRFSETTTHEVKIEEVESTT